MKRSTSKMFDVKVFWFNILESQIFKIYVYILQMFFRPKTKQLQVTPIINQTNRYKDDFWLNNDDINENLYQCSKCNKKIKSNTTMFFAYDKSFCCTECREDYIIGMQSGETN